MISDLFEHAALFHGGNITPLRNAGWRFVDDRVFGPFWKADSPGSELEFEVHGEAISLIFYRIQGAMGVARVWLDDKPVAELDASHDQTWGGYHVFHLLARDLAAGRHRLRIAILDKKNPASTGHEFRLHAVLAAGPDSRASRAKSPK